MFSLPQDTLHVLGFVSWPRITRVTSLSALCCTGLCECSLHQMPPAAAEGLPPGKQHDVQKRDLPERERQIAYITYAWNLKYATSEPIYDTETDSRT